MENSLLSLLLSESPVPDHCRHVRGLDDTMPG